MARKTASPEPVAEPRHGDWIIVCQHDSDAGRFVIWTPGMDDVDVHVRPAQTPLDLVLAAVQVVSQESRTRSQDTARCTIDVHTDHADLPLLIYAATEPILHHTWARIRCIIHPTERISDTLDALMIAAAAACP
jgi:hypothetical protein